ncbi:MAG: hypothetical protein JNJ41_06485 [Bacteroidia bacterium]|nr:hypothetical protein [Bacteroidia bacterium]
MKKITHYYILLFFLLFIIGFNKTAFSQDSLLRKPKHIIGYAIQRTPNTAKYEGHAESSATYKTPNYNLFYRFLMPVDTNWMTAFTASFDYRRGHGYSYNGGRGGGSSVSGDFEFCRLGLGVSPQRRYGKHKNFVFGGGFNLGYLIYAKGNIKRHNFSQGIATDSEESAYNVISKMYVSLNFEISQAFKISSKKYLILGVKQYFESPDYTGTRLNLTTSLFLACNLR